MDTLRDRRPGADAGPQPESDGERVPKHSPSSRKGLSRAASPPRLPESVRALPSLCIPEKVPVATSPGPVQSGEGERARAEVSVCGLRMAPAMLVFSGSGLEYAADNVIGMMAAAGWAQSTYAAFPFAAQLLAPQWATAVTAAVGVLSAFLVLAHRAAAGLLVRRYGDLLSQRVFYCLLWLVRPLVVGLCGGLCAAVELFLGPSSAQATLVLLLIAAAANMLAVLSTLLQFRSGCGETTWCFTTRTLQVLAVTAAGRCTYGLWAAVARGVARGGPLHSNGGGLLGSLGTYCFTHAVLTAMAIPFFSRALVRRPRDRLVNIAVVDVLQFSVLFCWSTDHVFCAWEVTRALGGMRGTLFGGYRALYGFRPFELPTPDYFWLYGVALIALASAAAWRQPNKAFVPVDTELWWAAVWFMWTVQGVWYTAWGGYQGGLPVAAQVVCATFLSLLQIGLYAPAEELKARGQPPPEPLQALPSTTKLHETFRVRFADSFTGVASPGVLDGTFGPLTASLGRSFAVTSFAPTEPIAALRPGSFVLRSRAPSQRSVLVVQPETASDATGFTGSFSVDPVPLVPRPPSPTAPRRTGSGIAGSGLAAGETAEGPSSPRETPPQLGADDELVCYTPCPPVVTLMPAMLARAATHPDILVTAPSAAALTHQQSVRWTGPGFTTGSFAAAQPLSSILKSASRLHISPLPSPISTIVDGA
eukprot:TRINITY_DN35084_c0_g1_i1.p1 TRINITY_DN35084_c0_g1~~TRINITY_DN35084_c0_g1_i1.p1  ORF type:complete len:747 (+),score=185.41 TRINITY_DN35084_c0_g1_i1:130-2241(+)